MCLYILNIHWRPRGFTIDIFKSTGTNGVCHQSITSFVDTYMKHPNLETGFLKMLLLPY